MLGDYVLHYPITDFAVSLLAIAALIEIGRIVRRREAWAPAVDLLLFLGFAGAVASVGTGLWLTSIEDHGHSRALTIHHYFAYGTLGVATIAVLARVLEGRKPGLAKLKTAMLLVSAALVSGAGFYGGKMAHGADRGHADPDDSPPPTKRAVPANPPDRDSRPHTH